jgi:hypothetical protein
LIQFLSCRIATRPDTKITVRLNIPIVKEYRKTFVEKNARIRHYVFLSKIPNDEAQNVDLKM